jgi:hypothetical protein
MMDKKFDFHDLYDPPEYFPMRNPRFESVDKLYEIYKREHEKLKEYAAFERTLSEIEVLPITKTDFGD